MTRPAYRSVRLHAGFRVSRLFFNCLGFAGLMWLIFAFLVAV